MHCIPLNNNVCFKQGASLIVNPLTTLAFIDIAKKQGSKAIVNTAAASAVGKMLVRLAKSEDLPLINIVRKESQAAELNELGAKYILNSSEADFGEKFKSLSHQLEATQIFDAVTGELTPILLDNAPKSSTIYLYAKLDDRVMPIDQRQIVQQAKQIKGFFLSEYSQQKGLMKSLADVKKVQKMLGKEIQTTIKEIVSPEQLNNAIEEYKSDMGKGKILLKF
jgi:NADPH:quinone reductase-like Zn-dependent oxidoreductase